MNIIRKIIAKGATLTTLYGSCPGPSLESPALAANTPKDAQSNGSLVFNKSISQRNTS